jgi:flavin reductase (DIM6/NTAB) family NADH-FMN oxidoreductase RutF
MSRLGDECHIDLANTNTAPRELRNALGRFATGVTVITTRTSSGRMEGLTVNSFSAVSLDPPLVLWSLRREAPSLPSFVETGWFAINVLGVSQHHHSRRFAITSPDKFADVDWVPGIGGCPLLDGCIARFECRTKQTLGAGDHLIFIGHILRATYRDGQPLLFHAGAYHAAVRLDGQLGD